MKENIKKFLNRYLKTKIGLIILIIFLVLLAQLFSNALPYFYKLIVDKLTQFTQGFIEQSALISSLILLVSALFGFQLFKLIFQVLRMYLVNRFEAQIIRQIADDFVRHVLNLSFYFHAHRKTGEMTKRFGRGLKAAEEFMDDFIFNLFPNFFELCIVTVIYFVFDWQSGLILLVMIIAFIFSTTVLNNWQQKYRKIANDLEDMANRKAVDALMNIEAVKYFSQEAQEAKLFSLLNQKWQKAQLKFWNRYISVEFIQDFIIILGSLLILIFCISRVVNQSFTIGSLVMMLTYLSSVYFPLLSFQWVYRRLRTSITDLESIMDYFNFTNEIKDLPQVQDLVVKEGKIEFKNVSFAYQGGKKVLRDISFYVPAKKSVAIVGPSGVGKSTLIKLLYRFYEVTSGKILIDEQDIKEVKQESLRKNLVIVPQETALFNETIKYNIAYGKPNAKEGEVKKAAQFSKIFAFVKSLKNDFNTLVGERGIRLSGGEKQRVSIARAVLKNAPILILDEATSSLDSETEKEIQDSLQNLIKDKTTIIIAHRLSTVMKADYIVVLEKGQVAQMGTHEQLLEKGGLYQKLWALQAGGYIK